MENFVLTEVFIQTTVEVIDSILGQAVCFTCDFKQRIRLHDYSNHLRVILLGNVSIVQKLLALSE
jgi:hypothetical protein